MLPAIIYAIIYLSFFKLNDPKIRKNEIKIFCDLLRFINFSFSLFERFSKAGIFVESHRRYFKSSHTGESERVNNFL